METLHQPQTTYLSESEDQLKIIETIEKHLYAHDASKNAVQDEIREICDNMRAQIDELEERTCTELEEKFLVEDNRLQEALNDLIENNTISAFQKAKAELLVFQSYEITKNNEHKLDFATLYKLKTERRIVPELMEMRKPTDIRTAEANGRTTFRFSCFNRDEKRVLLDRTIVNPVKYKCMLFKKDNEQDSKEYPLYENENDPSSFLIASQDILEDKTTYGIRVKMIAEDRESEWSDVADFVPRFTECCVWKKCPDDVNEKRKYVVSEDNPRIAKKVNIGDECTIIGSAAIPLYTVISWGIKILESRGNQGQNIYVGVAPFDINQNDTNNYYKHGWYFNCFNSTLCSGPPHSYIAKSYGPRRGKGEYVHTGDRIGVVMDTTKGILSFFLNGANLGIAHEGIPLDKPLVPCVILRCSGDSVELNFPEVKENVDGSIPVPSNIAVSDETTCNTITLTWDEVESASFYQVEVDGSNSWHGSTTNTFTNRGLFPETEHNFRVRTVRGSSVSEWSSAVGGRTLKAPEFSECVWKKCPDYVDDNRKYSVDGRNPRIATKTNSYGNYCTVIGNTPIPLNTVTTWSIRILKSKYNSGGGIYIGVAPSDINQNNNNHNKYGWHFYCYGSELWSGPPHTYNNKKYGPRKYSGQYVHTGDSVGVVVDTTRGDLSFVLDGVNLGVAYGGIPLDKPLVPCVILKYGGDSVELIV